MPDQVAGRAPATWRRLVPVAAVQALVVVASACGSGSGGSRTPPPTLPAAIGHTVVTVTAGTPSSRESLTVQVGTVISVQMLSGATHIATFHSPGIGDYSILHTWPIPSADVPTDGSVSDYIAMRPGHTTVDAAAGSTHLLVTVTVTASSPTP